MSYGYSVELRTRALAYLDKGEKRQKVCDVFGISRKTLFNWIKPSREDTGDVQIKTRPKVQLTRKLHREALLAYLEKYPDHYNREIAQLSVSRGLPSFRPFVSLGSLGKKTTPYKKRDEKKREAFIAEIESLNSKDLVYVYESGIDHHHFRKYARSPINTIVYGDIAGNYLSRTTLIAGYVEGGFIAPFRFKG